jgi:hypothetical protein
MPATTGDATDLYLELLKRVLTNVIYRDPAIPNFLIPTAEYNGEAREAGVDWPAEAHTMVGLTRLANVQKCLEDVISDDVPGDFIETGVWRGGVCIFARGLFEAYGVKDRTVWVADSFEGIPTVGADAHPLDVELQLHTANDVLGVSKEQVAANFETYGLLDDRVRFLEGWFCDTLPTAPIEKLAVLRLDGDLYESTMDALNALYPKLSAGGYVIIDDYLIPACKQAVHEYRDAHGITDEIVRIDHCSVYWRRSA